jgi:hypothetical protein
LMITLANSHGIEPFVGQSVGEPLPGQLLD